MTNNIQLKLTIDNDSRENKTPFARLNRTMTTRNILKVTKNKDKPGIKNYTLHHPLNIRNGMVMLINKIRLSKKRHITYAIIGTGRIAHYHVKAIHKCKNARLAGVYNIHTQKAEAFAKLYKTRVYSSLNELLGDKTIDVVTICAPHVFHIEIAKKVIEHNKIVLSEKPFAINSKTLEGYLKNKKARENTYIILQNNFNDAVKKLFTVAHEGRLGIIQYIAIAVRWYRTDAYYSDWHGIKKIAGGAIFNQAIHNLGVMNRIVDLHAIEVSSYQKTIRRNSEIDDICSASFLLKNRVLGSIELSTYTKESDLESYLFVIGTKGSVKIGGLNMTTLMLADYEGSESKGRLKFDSEKDAFDYFGTGHEKLFKTFTNHLLGIPDPDENLLVKVSEILPIIQFIEQLYLHPTIA
jgi:UDP-N-acetyl-2-amino-2-deoxyglucuronate dehydrogenase